MEARGYVIVDPSVSPEEREEIAKFNQSGGVTPRIYAGAALLVLTVVVFAAGLALPWKMATWPLLGAAIMILYVFYFRFARPLLTNLDKRWTTTNNQELMALDRDWLRDIENIEDAGRRGDEDLCRFNTLRMIARGNPQDAAREIKEAREHLFPGTT